MWSWRLDDGQYMPYAETVNATIEDAYQRNKLKVKISVASGKYDVDFMRMRQVSVASNGRRPIRRSGDEDPVAGLALQAQLADCLEQRDALAEKLDCGSITEDEGKTLQKVMDEIEVLQPRVQVYEAMSRSKTIAELIDISDRTPESRSKVRSRVESALGVADRQASARAADGVETVAIGTKKLYHQTSIDGASSILKSQYFRPSPPSSWFGAGTLAKLNRLFSLLLQAGCAFTVCFSLTQASILPTRQRRPHARRSTPARFSRSR